jgi:hypothetical protein
MADEFDDASGKAAEHLLMAQEGAKFLGEEGRRTAIAVGKFLSWTVTVYLSACCYESCVRWEPTWGVCPFRVNSEG